MKRIRFFLDNLECPSLDGIMFPDDSIQLLEVGVKWELPVRYTIKLADRVLISDFIEKDLWWSNCAVIEDLVDEKK